MRKICFVTIILTLFLCSCSINQKTDSNKKAYIPKTLKTEAALTADNSSKNKESTSAKSSSGSSGSKYSNNDWPREFEGKLPKPDCKITNVARYDEKSMSGKLTIVNFSDMSKENAEKYVKELKDMGFSGGIEISNDKKIIFSGVGKDSSAKNGINFDYDESAKNGSISY